MCANWPSGSRVSDPTRDDTSLWFEPDYGVECRGTVRQIRNYLWPGIKNIGQRRQIFCLLLFCGKTISPQSQSCKRESSMLICLLYEPGYHLFAIHDLRCNVSVGYRMTIFCHNRSADESGGLFGKTPRYADEEKSNQ